MSSVAVVLSVVESRTAVVKIHAQVGRAASSTPGPISGRRAAAVDVGVAILASGGGRRGRRSGGTLLARCRTPFFFRESTLLTVSVPGSIADMHR